MDRGGVMRPQAASHIPALIYITAPDHMVEMETVEESLVDADVSHVMALEVNGARYQECCEVGPDCAYVPSMLRERSGTANPR